MAPGCRTRSSPNAAAVSRARDSTTSTRSWPTSAAASAPRCPPRKSFYDPETADLMEQVRHQEPEVHAEEAHRVFRDDGEQTVRPVLGDQMVAGVHGGGSPVMEDHHHDGPVRPRSRSRASPGTWPASIPRCRATSVRPPRRRPCWIKFKKNGRTATRSLQLALSQAVRPPWTAGRRLGSAGPLEGPALAILVSGRRVSGGTMKGAGMAEATRRWSDIPYAGLLACAAGWISTCPARARARFR